MCNRGTRSSARGQLSSQLWVPHGMRAERNGGEMWWGGEQRGQRGRGWRTRGPETSLVVLQHGGTAGERQLKQSTEQRMLEEVGGWWLCC